MKRIYLVISLMMIATLALAVIKQDMSNVTIKPEKLTDKVYMLQGRGGNIGVSIGDDGVLMIDDQFAPLSEKIKAAIRELGGSHPKYILNTHYHGDHTGGNAEFSKEGTIVAHTNVRKRLSTPQQRRGQTVDPKPKEMWPQITFDQSIDFHFNGETVKVRHYPNGHTDGDAVVYFTESNVLHMGDKFFAGRFPYVDLNAGGNVQGLIKNIEEIVSMVPADVKIIPGHGPLCSMNDLQTYLDMLKTTSAVVSEKMKNGMALDDIKAAGLGDEWTEWGTGYISTDSWISTIYNSSSSN